MFPEIKNYKIIREIGTGGMAIVYEALDERLGRRVAIKVLHHHLQSDLIASERFIKEARAAARIDHPNVVRIYDVGIEKNLFFIVMEYVPGINLEEILKEKGKLSFEQTLTIMYEIGEALAEAHSLNIIHRDVKPANILIHKQGRAMLSDFGLAKYLSDPKLTTDDVIVGTPLFMAPEQISKKAITLATDIYSWGICFYRLLCGKLPYKVLDFPEILTSIKKGEICLDSEEFNQMPSNYQEIIHRCLFANPEERIKDGKELITLLSEAEKDKKIKASLVELLEKASSKEKERVNSTTSSSATLVIAKEDSSKKENILKKSLFAGIIIVSLISIILILTAEQKRSKVSISERENNRRITINSVVTEDEKKGNIIVDSIYSEKINIDTNVDKRIKRDSNRIAFSKTSTLMNISKKEIVDVDKIEKTRDSGFLFISCSPWAYVFIDGKEIGTTPLEKPITLSTGKHFITLVNDFSDTIFDTIDIKADSLFKKKYKLNIKRQ